MKVASIGLGLIGGSFALSLKKNFDEIQLYGMDKNPKHLQKALQLNIIDKALSDEDVIEMDLIVVSIPVDKANSVIQDVLDKVHPKALVMDMGSTKGKLCKAIAEHPKRDQFLAAHPIAGTEFSGPEAAFSLLFEKKTMIFCDVEASRPELLDMALSLIAPLEMSIKYMGAQDHDKHLAYVSHLSHISSFMLGKTVLQVEQNDKTIFDLAGSGFASTVRLAKSNPTTWTAIFKENQNEVLQALEEYIQNLKAFQNQLETQNYSEIHQQLANANELKPILNGILKKESHGN
ncbi:prephenate dehydrogenase [Psychroflexus lacisalsi]|jgi:prephenate dehydrogenase|uniref:Prephenate dehydrogenase n=1 Tax=Psychroflexus lacisalsi TaxID=503928 RepID=A0ABP3VG43_9FLAO|nr:prephenate dehydrogenase [Psychroflexus lacisalsi]MBZ9618834.1 prephenate dehydrogenase [Psychroflexus lacisalsi]